MSPFFPCRGRVSPRRTGVLLLTTIALIPALRASEVPESDMKPYTLFMGAELMAEHGHEMRRVVDVVGRSFVLETKPQPTAVAVDKHPVKLRVDLGLKLTEIAATVDGLKVDRAYSPQADPVLRYRRQMPGAADLAMINHGWLSVAAALRAQAAGQAGGGQVAAPGAVANVSSFGESNVGEVGPALKQWDNEIYSAGSDLNSNAYFSGKMAEELAKQLYDAIDLGFDVSSARLLERPHLLVVANYRERDERPGGFHSWIFAQALPPIGPQPQHVRIRQAGFPEGYTLVNYQVHLYNEGTEVATNVAAKRVPLTREEAFQYVMLEYLSAHKRATLAPAPALGHLPADLPSRLSRGDYAEVFYVKVTAEGRATGVFRDAACARPVDDAYLLELVQGLRFKPALAAGKPVDGVARLNLRDLPLSF